MKNPYELMPFQLDGVRYIKERKYSYLADDMGLGKSIQSMTAALELGAKKILIVCPSSIITQWHEVAKKFFPDYFFETFTNKPLQSRHFSKFILISGYSRAGTNQGKLKLLQLQYDFVIVDESHFLKNPQAKRTKNILGGRSICTVTGKESPGSFLANAKQVCLMSGTPILNRPSEAYIILKSFAPKSLGKYLPWPVFVRRFCGFQAKGATHTEELSTILSQFILRRTKEQVLTELPPIVETVVNVPGIIDNEDEFLPTRRKLVSLEKVDFTIEYVKDLLETIDKVLLVAYHRETIEKLQQAFKHSVILQGGMTNDQKQKSIIQFQTNAECKVLIGQINVVGYGIDGLQKVCNYIVFGEIDWSPGILEQAKDRLRRIGQTNTVFAHYLIASGTIEEDIDLKLEWKRDVISKLIKPADMPIIKKEPKPMERQLAEVIEMVAANIAEKVVAKVLTALPTHHTDVLPDPKPAAKKERKIGPGSVPSVLTPEQAMVVFGERTTATEIPAANTVTLAEAALEYPTAPDRAILTSEAQMLLGQLKANGVSKEEADGYYKNVLLDGFTFKRISDMPDVELVELRKRLDDHDLASALAFLTPKTVEVDEV